MSSCRSDAVRSRRATNTRPWRVTYTERVRGVIHTIALTLLLTGAPIIAADDLELSFSDGRVTVIATDVPVRTILQEWARVGETEFVDADKLTGRPVRLQLVDVPEATALRVLLRQAAGYVAAPRAERTPDASRFDRVLVMTASRRPASSSYTPSLGSSAPGPVPAQRGPTSVPGFSADSSLDEFDNYEFDDDELEELRELLPEPFSFIDRSARPDDQRFGNATASRPGMVVSPSDDEPAVFLRGPVRPQAPDDPR